MESVIEAKLVHHPFRALLVLFSKKKEKVGIEIKILICNFTCV